METPEFTDGPCERRTFAVAILVSLKETQPGATREQAGRLTARSLGQGVKSGTTGCAAALEPSRETGRNSSEEPVRAPAKTHDIGRGCPRKLQELSGETQMQARKLIKEPEHR